MNGENSAAPSSCILALGAQPCFKPAPPRPLKPPLPLAVACALLPELSFLISAVPSLEKGLEKGSHAWEGEREAAPTSSVWGTTD